MGKGKKRKKKSNDQKTVIAKVCNTYITDAFFAGNFYLLSQYNMALIESGSFRCLLWVLYSYDLII